MSDNGTDAPARPPARGRPDPGGRYLAVTGVLLVVIIALLAVLWGRERARRRAAESRAAQWRVRYEQLQQAVGGLLIKPDRAAAEAASRASGRGDGAAADGQGPERPGTAAETPAP